MFALCFIVVKCSAVIHCKVIGLHCFLMKVYKLKLVIYIKSCPVDVLMYKTENA